MSKKIILVSAIILILTVAFTACKGKNDDPAPESTDKVVQTVTVTGKDGGVTTVEIYEDASGNQYITNVDGEKVPVTADSEGFFEDIGFVVTSKPSNSNNSTPSSSNEEKNTGNNNPTGSTEPSSISDSSSNSEIVIGSKVQQDSIEWEDIKNPKK